MQAGFLAKSAFTTQTDPDEAVADLKNQLGEALSLVFLFVSTAYDLEALGPCIASQFQGVVAACTTAGQVGIGGVDSGGISALGLGGSDLAATSHFIPSLGDPALAVAGLQEEFALSTAGAPREWSRFGIVLCDGLSGAEESLAKNLYLRLPGFQILGGSAGDDLRFARTMVYHGGRFRSGTASVVLLYSKEPLRSFRTHGVETTSTRLVVTAMGASPRDILELNGLPAAETYARVLGHDPGELGGKDFALNPLLLKVGGVFYVRTPRVVLAGGGLAMHSAVDLGQVLTLGQEGDILSSTEEALSAACQGVDVQAVLVFECVARRILLDQIGSMERATALFRRYRCTGFGAYGEQQNGIHMNQTLTGLVLGVPHGA